MSFVTVSLNGDKVATTSEKGMNIRVFNSESGELLQELRRGNEYGQIYSLSFSRGGNWLSCTSDSNKVHVFASVPSPQGVCNPQLRDSTDTNRIKRNTRTLSRSCTSLGKSFPISMLSIVSVPMLCLISKQSLLVLQALDSMTTTYS